MANNLRQRALNGDEDALDELLRQTRESADEQRDRADYWRERADQLQRSVKQLEYVFIVNNRCTIEYLRMRPLYMTY